MKTRPADEQDAPLQRNYWKQLAETIYADGPTVLSDLDVRDKHLRSAMWMAADMLGKVASIKKVADGYLVTVTDKE